MIHQRKIMISDHHHVPFDIQTIIMKMLPAKSLLRFRGVSKQWKSLIDSSEFIKTYQTRNEDPHILVRYRVRINEKLVSTTYHNVSILDNDSFPKHMSPITVPLSIETLNYLKPLGSSHGIICFLGKPKDTYTPEMVVFWNPSIRKSVSALMETQFSLSISWVGFGVCPETRDPKLVHIYHPRGIPQVEVYSLSTRTWKQVSLKPPNKLYGCQEIGVCVEGLIYWLARDDSLPPCGNGSNSIISFNLSNEVFGTVLLLPSSLQRSKGLKLFNWNECLTVCDYHHYDNLFHWDVWMMKADGYFTMMFCIDSIHEVHTVFEFLKNGQAIIKRGYEKFDSGYSGGPTLQVYDPCSGGVNDNQIPWSRHNDIGPWTTSTLLSTSSYMETLLLLDQ